MVALPLKIKNLHILPLRSQAQKQSLAMRGMGASGRWHQMILATLVILLFALDAEAAILQRPRSLPPLVTRAPVRAQARQQYNPLLPQSLLSSPNLSAIRGGSVSSIISAPSRFINALVLAFRSSSTLSWLALTAAIVLEIISNTIMTIVAHYPASSSRRLGGSKVGFSAPSYFPILSILLSFVSPYISKSHPAPSALITSTQSLLWPPTRMKIIQSTHARKLHLASAKADEERRLRKRHSMPLLLCLLLLLVIGPSAKGSLLLEGGSNDLGLDESSNTHKNRGVAVLDLRKTGRRLSVATEDLISAYNAAAVGGTIDLESGTTFQPSGTQTCTTLSAALCVEKAVIIQCLGENAHPVTVPLVGTLPTILVLKTAIQLNQVFNLVALHAWMGISALGLKHLAIFVHLGHAPMPSTPNACLARLVKHHLEGSRRVSIATVLESIH